MEFTLSKYSDKSYVLRGDATRFFKSILLEHNCKYNARLQGGAGYIIPQSKYNEIKAILEKIVNGEISPTDEVDLNKINKVTVIYTNLYQPKVNEVLNIKINDNLYQYTVTEVIKNSLGYIDNVVISSGDNKALLQISNGFWQIRGYLPEHTVIFTNNNDNIDTNKFTLIEN